jgi:hypothetical protein
MGMGWQKAVVLYLAPAIAWADRFGIAEADAGPLPAGTMWFALAGAIAGLVMALQKESGFSVGWSMLYGGIIGGSIGALILMLLK